MSVISNPHSSTSQTVTPTDGMVIRESMTLTPGTYMFPQGLSIEADNVTVAGEGVTLIGANRQNSAISVTGCKNVTIRGFRILEYFHGIAVRKSENITVEANEIASTGEVEDNSIFLNIWTPAENAYGGAILFDTVIESTITGNHIAHQMNGLQTYDCRQLVVRRNNANFNSGFGFHLNGTCDSVFEENWADFCCRYQPRDRSPELPNGVVGANHYGHMGADATGFLIINKSCQNVFRKNFARCGGDGFFLAGRSPANEDVGCNDNLFEENDGSLSPNIAFEATFSSGNVFRNNWADRCNYGFWLGFSTDNVLEGNRMLFNRQAGIGTENGARFVVRGNDFQANGHAILLWSKYIKAYHDALPDTRTSHDWDIVANKFTKNGIAIAIYADKDHGIRPMPASECGNPEVRPYCHSIIGNDIQDNRVGIHLINTDKTVIRENKLNANVEANLRRDEDMDTEIGPNLGNAGAYL